MQQPLLTREVRWFGRGAIPAELQSWFDHLGEIQTQPPRVDLYLAGMDASVGIKLREGLLEIKPRMEDYGIQTFLAGVAGRVGGWSKWSFSLAESDWLGSEAAYWIPVEKVRQILYFRYGGAGEITLSLPGELPESGGGLELTAVKLSQESRWWTLGFEVIGPQEEQGEILPRLARHAFDRQDRPMLPAEKSFSYPEWLAKYSQKRV